MWWCRERTLGTRSQWITEAERIAFGEEREQEWINEILSRERLAESLNVQSNSSAYDSHGNTEGPAENQHHQTDENSQEGGQHEESGGQEAGGSNGGGTGGEQERGAAGGQRRDNDKEDKDNDKEDKDNDKEDSYNDKEDSYNDEEDSYSDEEDSDSTCQLSTSEDVVIFSDDSSVSTFQPSISEHGESSSDFSSESTFQQMIRKDEIRIGFLNSNSINNKQSRISELINKFNLEALTLTETRVTLENGDQRLGEISPGEFQVLHQPRVNEEGESKKHTGGGVATLLSNDLRGTRVRFEDMSFESFEYVAVDVYHGNWTRPLWTITVYRPPGGNDEDMLKFRDDFQNLLNEFSKDDSILIIGDFNIWVNDKNNKHAKWFKKLLEDNGFHQQVEEPTHNRGNTLDLVIIRNVHISILRVKKPKKKIKTKINKQGKKKKINITISDHYAVLISVRPKYPTDPSRKRPKDRKE